MKMETMRTKNCGGYNFMELVQRWQDFKKELKKNQRVTKQQEGKKFIMNLIL